MTQKIWDVDFCRHEYTTIFRKGTSLVEKCRMCGEKISTYNKAEPEQEQLDGIIIVSTGPMPTISTINDIAKKCGVDNWHFLGIASRKNMSLDELADAIHSCVAKFGQPRKE